MRPVTQMVASSADDAIRSSEANSSPWMMEKVQSSDEAPGPRPVEPDEAEEEAVEAAAATDAPAAAVTDVVTDEPL